MRPDERNSARMLSARDFPSSWNKPEIRKIIGDLEDRCEEDTAARNVADSLVHEVRWAKEDFGGKCGKFSGALAVEITRARLRAHGFAVSDRDVFIRGLPIELDLVVPRKGAVPLTNLLYEPADVCAVLEIKNCGCFGQQAVVTVKTNFEQVKDHVPGVTCVYVTVEERPTFKYAVTDTNVGAPVCTLAWHKDTNGPYWPTTDWQKLLLLLHNASRGIRA